MRFSIQRPERVAAYLLIAVALSTGLWSCEPEPVPDPDPIDNPDPAPDPTPDPTPTPDPAPDPEPAPDEQKDYIERPQTIKPNSNYKYIDHRGTTYRTGQKVRNYEACYDVRRHNPMWVAFPCHEIYWEGDYTRPTKDPWRPEPNLEESEQSIIYAEDWQDWPWSSNSGNPTDKFQYWSPMPTGKTVTKGHLMRSAERGCGNKTNPIDLNVQTYYPTNIAPESYLNETDSDSH